MRFYEQYALGVMMGLAGLVATGCPSDADPSPAGTTGAAMTGTTTAPVTTTAMPMTVGQTATDDGPGTSSGDGDSSGDTLGATTGGLADCVDEDIGSAVGRAVATGNTMGQGDDFDWAACTFGGSGGVDSAGDGGTAATSGGSGGTSGGSGGTSGGATTGGMRGPGDDYVISWTAPQAGDYVFGLATAQFDTTISVVPPMCGTEATDCNDDCYGLASGLAYSATKGETLFIVVDGYGGRVGDFTLDIMESADPMCEGGMDTGAPR